MLTFALLFAVGWAQTPSNPTCCSHSYWTDQCTACPGYWYQSCSSGYTDVDQKGCGFLGCETKCTNSCRYKNYGCGCNNSKACHTACSPVSCIVGGFGEWGSCSNTCGGGKQRRTRSVMTKASCGGTPCPALFEERDCNTYECTPEPTEAPTKSPTETPTPAPLVMYQYHENGSCAEQSLKNSNEKNNVKECAEFCKDTKDCVYFAFRPSSKGNQNCVLYKGSVRSIGRIDPKTNVWLELGFRTYTVCTKKKNNGYTTYKMDQYLKMSNKGNKCHKDHIIKDLRSCQNAAAGKNVQVVKTSSKILGCSESRGQYYFNTVDGYDHEGKSWCHEDHVTRRPCGVAWAAWGACSKSCNSGTQKRTGVKIQPTYGGTPCSATLALEQSRACNTKTCEQVKDATSCKSAWKAAKKAAEGSKRKCKAIDGKFKKKKCKHKSKLRCSRITRKTADDKLLCLCIPGCAPETKQKFKGKKCKGTGTPL